MLVEQRDEVVPLRAACDALGVPRGHFAATRVDAVDAILPVEAAVVSRVSSSCEGSRCRRTTCGGCGAQLTPSASARMPRWPTSSSFRGTARRSCALGLPAR